MPKNLIFCADGTWNSPDEDDDHDRCAEPTNVTKLFQALDGELRPESSPTADEQEKVLADVGGTLQTAKYLHGVGDSGNPIMRLLGGAFGAGVISRIVRGYTFLSRHFEPGASLFIVGFSRGAYTARALAGLIANEGLLNPALTRDREQAYRCGAEAWYRYRKRALKDPFQLAHLGEIAAEFPAFLSCGALRDSDLVPVDRIAAVGVWDTVGAMGFPAYTARGARVDAFRFADTRLHPKVARGFHALALDERRNDFAPTLWEPDGRVDQALFPGAHGDVGGGYPISHGESGLSDLTLAWMLARLTNAGLRASAGPPQPFQPDAAGTAHQPWVHLPWSLPGVSLGPRAFPAALPQDPSIAARMAAPAVADEPGATPRPYRPANLPREGSAGTPGSGGL